ncbi:MAG: molybdate ABC transporter substrate-binding protein [Oscillospiraceae bacterium]|nr:molybdate ABC transporter substrate-binding protein [Oscillospiraceae bacterium]
MKQKTLVWLLAAVLLPALAGCGRQEDAKLTVYAAASLTETLTEISETYKDAELCFNFDSSGTLATQIEEGSACDLFISAAPKQMDQLEEDSLLADGTRLDLLENQVVLAVPEGNPADISSFDDLAARLKAGEIHLAIGNGDVPVGQYTEKIFDFYGIDAGAAADCLTYGSNVKEVTTQVFEAAVDCGIVYATDAFSAGLTAVDAATPEMCGQVIYPAAVLKDAADREAAQAFLEYLTGDEAGAVFASVGFTPLT